MSVEASAETTGRGGLYFGKKSLSSDWGSFDSQGAWGIDLDMKDTSWPVWVTAGYVSSSDSERVVTSNSPYTTKDAEGKTSEIHLGAKKDFFPIEKVRVSIAGGPAYIRASLDGSVSPFSSSTDSSVGVWAGADGFIFLGHLVLGVTYQYSHANVNLLGRSMDAGGKNLSFSIGFGW